MWANNERLDGLAWPSLSQTHPWMIIMGVAVEADGVQFVGIFLEILIMLMLLLFLHKPCRCDRQTDTKYITLKHARLGLKNDSRGLPNN